MKAEISRRIDPRTGLFLLICANLIAFSRKDFRLEAAWIVGLTLLYFFCGLIGKGVKLLAGFVALLLLQRYILPIAPGIIATSFSIFVNYMRRLYPCLMIGNLMIKTISLHSFITGLRKLRISQKIIIPISVTLRYFPAIREEAGYIRDAMRLKNIKGMARLEAMAVPIMMSATQTAEELSAAAVTRGVENPVRKTSMIHLKLCWLDYVYLAFGTVTVICSL